MLLNVDSPMFNYSCYWEMIYKWSSFYNQCVDQMNKQLPCSTVNNKASGGYIQHLFGKQSLIHIIHAHISQKWGGVSLGFWQDCWQVSPRKPIRIFISGVIEINFCSLWMISFTGQITYISTLGIRPYNF